VALGQGIGMGVIANGHEVSFWGDGNILKLGCFNGC